MQVSQGWKVQCPAMTSGWLRYEGGEIADRDAFRLTEPEMSDEEYQAYRAVWWKQFPSRCGGSYLCQGPPGRRPRRVRTFVELPDESPQGAGSREASVPEIDPVEPAVPPTSESFAAAGVGCCTCLLCNACSDRQDPWTKTDSLAVETAQGWSNGSAD